MVHVVRRGYSERLLGDMCPWSPRPHPLLKEDRALGGTLNQSGMRGAPVCVMAKLAVDIGFLPGGGGTLASRRCPKAMGATVGGGVPAEVAM